MVQTDLTELLSLEMLAQPSETTCGPTSLQAVYRFYGDNLDLDRVIREVPELDQGGTLAVFLACHALRRNYKATIYSYNLQLFDPIWFGPGIDLKAKLLAQREAKPDATLRFAIDGYLDYLKLGGLVKFEDLTLALIRKHLTRGRPILTGLSATYLYHDPRELGDCTPDDVRGYPAGHFVVLCGYDRQSRRVLVADPLHPNPLSETRIYQMDIERVMGAILLGIITYDANLLILEPTREAAARRGT